MNSLFGNLGIVGLAVALTVLLLIGIKGGGMVKPLGWRPCLTGGILAGSSYAAAGGIFKIAPDFVGGLLDAAQGIIPGSPCPRSPWSSPAAGSLRSDGPHLLTSGRVLQDVSRAELDYGPEASSSALSELFY
ncbi:MULTISPECIES: hypothetical protein [unclassified Streptomyces]|uniref:hypothetical protein n=1 Tax=unclassified Streptomyces TaxID=2593676 RepID=UPI0035E15D95